MVPPGKVLGSGFVYVGNPCRVLRPVSSSEIKFFTYSPGNYVKLKDQYLAERDTSASTGG
jgi:carbonic anhydrase/acetyltransferase-like protein (isoleucine patch superfamily)